MRNVLSKSSLNVFLNKKLWLALILATGVSACSSESEESGESSHEVLAIDRVDDAARLAIENAPVAEPIEFPETAPVPVATTDDGTMPATDTMPEDGVADADMAETESTTTTTTEGAPELESESVTTTEAATN